MDWWMILLIVLAVLAVLVFFGASYTVKHAFLPVRKKEYDYYRDLYSGRCHDPERCRALIGRMLELPLERVEIKSHDGLNLVGHYYNVNDGAPVEIFFHGFRGCWQRDFCGIAEAAEALGHNILFVDQRSHGASEGKYITYGIKERLDAFEWIKYVIERFGEKTDIVLVGASMGGATVLSCADLPLPPSVKAIISDSAFTSAVDIISQVAAKGAFLQRLAGVGAWLTAHIVCGFNLSESSAIESVKNTEIPILLIHGAGDKLVPHSMAEEIVKANPKIRLESFDKADHIQPYLVDTERYRAVYKEFLENCGVKV